MKILSWIRWKFVIPVGIILVAMVVFFALFFDPLVEKGIEWGASKANGAKVELDHFKTSFVKQRVEITRIQVTDNKNVMKNVVDMGPLAFQVDLSELFSKRVIIPEASLEGLKFNTDRKYSGALPSKPKPAKDEKPSAAEVLFDKYKGRFNVSLDGMKDQAKAKIEFDPKELEITKTGDTIKTNAIAFPDKWKQKVDSINVDGRLKQAENDLKSLKGMKFDGVDAITQVPAALKKLNQVKSDLDKIKSDIKQNQNDFNAELKTYKNAVNDLKAAKQRDINNLKSRLNLDFADPHRLMEAVIGPSVLGNFRKGIGYVQTVRKYMPTDKDKESVPEKPRARGMDIKFPTAGAPPRFWLKLARLSGMFQDVTAKGEIKQLTSDPDKVGQPTKMDLSGSKGPIEFLAEGVFNHVGQNANDSFAIDASNVPLDMFLESTQSGAFLAGGSGKAKINVAVDKLESLSGGMGLTVRGFEVKTETLYQKFGVDPNQSSAKIEETLKKTLVDNLAASMKKIPALNIEAKLTGTLTNPDFSFSSNLTEAFSQAIKESVSGTLKKGQEELEAKLNAIVSQYNTQINEEVTKAQAKVNDALSKLDKDTQAKIQEATGISFPGATGKSLPQIKIPSLDKLFKK